MKFYRYKYVINLFLVITITNTFIEMSLFDKLPYDLTDIIYKNSYKEHMDKLPNEVYHFHLKLAKKKNSYELVQVTNMDQFNIMFRDLIKRAKAIQTIDTISKLHEKLFLVETACTLIQMHKEFLLSTNRTRLVNASVEKLKSLREAPLFNMT